MEQIAKELGDYTCSAQTVDWLWSKAKAAWKRSELIRLDTLNALVEAEPLEAHEPLLETVLEVWKSEPSTTPLADCEILRNLHRHDKMARGMDRAVKAMSRGDLDNAREVMVGIVGDTAPVGFGLQVESLIDFEDWDAAAEGFKGIPTGIGTYDELTLGGASRGDLGVILGNTGMGKSILATNIGFAALKHGLNILHNDSENGMDRSKARYIGRALRTPTNPILRRRISDDVRGWMERQAKRINQHLKLICFGVDVTPLDELDAKITELMASGWKPDVIITDSPDHLIVNSKSDNSGQLAQMRYARMKSIAQRCEAAHWVVTQAKPESEGKIVTNKHVAWGHDKARLADHVWTINPGLDGKGNPLSEKEMGSSRSLFVAKARGSQGRFILPLKTDLASAYITEGIAGMPDEDEAPADVGN